MRSDYREDARDLLSGVRYTVSVPNINHTLTRVDRPIMFLREFAYLVRSLDSCRTTRLRNLSFFLSPTLATPTIIRSIKCKQSPVY